MEKRLILAVVLSVLVLIFWQRLSHRLLPESQPSRDTEQTALSEGKAQNQKGQEAPFPKTLTTPITSFLRAPEEPILWLETLQLKIGIGEDTGVLRHVFVKGYKEDLRKDAPMVDLAYVGPGILSPPVFAYATPDGFERLKPIRVELDKEGGQTEVSVLFEGMKAVYKILNQGYTLSFSIVKEASQPLKAPVFVLWPFGTGKQEGEDRYHVSNFQALKGKKLYNVSLAKLSEAKELEGPFPWVGFGDKFFFQALIDDTRPFLQARLIPLNTHGYVLSVPLFDPIASKQALSRDMTLFMGPKAYDTLKAQGHDLVKVIDFGMFGFLGRPLLVTLKFFHRLLANWGLAIIAVTVLLKLLLAPLTHQSYESMRRMTALQPKLKALQERYKNDRARMSQETMALYRAHKVNPLGGCLPTLIQIPVFFAFYYTLINTVELRHAPFFMWIQDLSAKDPYHITPLLMGGSMIALQLLTPNQQSTNPMQQRMMLIMPVVFIFIFLNLPSGLVLYYLFSNLLSIAHLIFFKQWQKSRPLPAPAS
jgi:YidC/Oxa1 family membrane protein insertase